MSARLIPIRNSALYAVVPNNSDTFNPPLSGIFVGGAAGNIVITRSVANGDDVSQSDLTITSAAAGSVITGVGMITAIKSTGTTATGLVGIL